MVSGDLAQAGGPLLYRIAVVGGEVSGCTGYKMNCPGKFTLQRTVSRPYLASDLQDRTASNCGAAILFFSRSFYSVSLLDLLERACAMSLWVRPRLPIRYSTVRRFAFRVWLGSPS